MYYKVGEAAQRLGISIPTLRRWCEKGKLRYRRTKKGHRRIHAEEIERLLALRKKAKQSKGQGGEAEEQRSPLRQSSPPDTPKAARRVQKKKRVPAKKKKEEAKQERDVGQGELFPSKEQKEAATSRKGERPSQRGRGAPQEEARPLATTPKKAKTRVNVKKDMKKVTKVSKEEAKQEAAADSEMFAHALETFGKRFRERQAAFLNRWKEENVSKEASKKR